VPVTVLCGFLGAGKTTLLRHWLAQAAGQRWAVVVNDVATLNIDGAVVRLGEAPGAAEIVELAGGCVCCSSGDDLAETLARLGAARDAQGCAFEHIFVETTGVAEPRGVAALFIRPNPFGRSLAEFVCLHTLVTVVDGALFAAETACAEVAVPARVAAPTGPRPVFELMLDQVETADVLVLNQCDRVGDETALAAVEARLGALNPRARIVRATHGQVAVAEFWGAPRFDSSATLGGARWVRELNRLGAELTGTQVLRPQARRATHAERFGIGTVTFQARAPFARARLEAWLRTAAPGLLRAKGFLWTADQPDEMQFLSLAGGVVRWTTLTPWWAAMVAAGRVRAAEVPPGVRARWVEPWGDRRQELVFLGVGVDAVSLQTGLSACLQA
jgi:G3E family GTPase